MRMIKLKKIAVFIVLLLCVLCIKFVFAAPEIVAEPGSDQDPLVSKSYIDASIDGIQKENAETKKLLATFQETIKNLKDEIELLKKQKTTEQAKFAVVTLADGQILYPGEGTEIVFRSGTGNAIEGQGGGLSDITSAMDLTNDMSITANHLLISAREDGRGIRALSQCWLLVRGSFRLEDKPKEDKPKEDKPTVQNPTEDKATEEKPKVEKLIGVVKASALNVRAQPDTKADVLASLKLGDSVEVLVKKETWYQVITSAGTTGWLSAEYLTIKQ